MKVREQIGLDGLSFLGQELEEDGFLAARVALGVGAGLIGLFLIKQAVTR